MENNMKIAKELLKLAKELNADADSPRNERMIKKMEEIGFKEVKELHHDTFMRYDVTDYLSVDAYVRNVGETRAVSSNGVKCTVDLEAFADTPLRPGDIDQLIGDLQEAKKKIAEALALK